jgi:transcriptional regulator with XRE-family HTH domain
MEDINLQLKERFKLTQEEVATLLGVTRSFYSMYRIGKRSLPLRAVSDLITLATNIEKGTPLVKDDYRFPEDEKKTQQWLQKELLNTNYKLQVAKKKMVLLQNKRTRCFAKLDFAHILEQAPLEERMARVITLLKIEAKEGLQIHTLQKLTELELEKASLEMLKNKIGEKLNLWEK